MRLTSFVLGACLFLQNIVVGFQPKPMLLKAKDMAFRRRSSHAFSKKSDSATHSSDHSKVGTASDEFLNDFFRSECDDFNVPPSLSVLLKSISQLASGSDIRGRFVDHHSVGTSMPSVAQAVSRSPLPALTPLSAHCLGYAFALMLQNAYPKEEEVLICVGRDPRSHGTILADAFARGAEGVAGTRVVYTGIASTPALFEFCRSSLCDGGVMVTASHLPMDRNGFKFFTTKGGFTKKDIQTLVSLTRDHIQRWYDMSILPPASGQNAVFCSEWVDWMPHYELELKHALVREVNSNHDKHTVQQTLRGLKIVLNAGNGSGGFFQRVLKDLGADVSASINIDPDARFPSGIPNPESQKMIDETIMACEESHADIGIVLDTDADRCGVVLPRTVGPGSKRANFEPLNRNRLIAMIGVILASQSPGATIVTDSVTSNGLSDFLEESLGLKHVRFLRGYANVIEKAKALSASGEANAMVAIETSGHCAMQENGYLDDGTYTAVKIIGLLARERSQNPTTSLLDKISTMKELDEVHEARVQIKDGTLETTRMIFDLLALNIETESLSRSDWNIDRENLEGIRISTGVDGSFFMLRKSLHDPILSLQIEASNKTNMIETVLKPLQRILRREDRIWNTLDTSSIDGLWTEG